MTRILAAICAVLLLAGFSCHAQNCPTTQATGINVGLCGPTPDHLLITPATTNISVGQQLQYQATMVFSNGTTGLTGDFTAECATQWASSSTAAATVNAIGVVTGVAAGTSTISCTLQNTVGAGNAAVTGSTTVTTLAAPNFQTPSQVCAQPCSLPNGLGPPSAVAYSFSFAATGGVPPYTWSVSVGALPGWASLNSSTGAITGTPNAVATTTFTAKVCDTIPSCNTLQVSLQVVANNTSFFPNSTTSSLAQNKVAGCNSNVPSASCGTAAATTYSVTTNVATINVANTFNSGEIVGISGCTSATFLNGTVLTTNGSTTTSAVVGAWANTQGTALTHANVGATADTTCYLQGQGWNPFVSAPFPAPGSTNCTQGNPCPGQTGVLTSADINTWALDWGTPSGALNTAPKNIITMLTNPATTSGVMYHPSKSGETYDQTISLDDTSNGYFFAAVQGGVTNIAHGHIAPTGCGGNPCFLMDTPVPSGWWNGPPTITDGAFSMTVRPGVNQALWFWVDLKTNQYQPTIKSTTLTYSATGCSGQPCVTAGTITTVANLSTVCPANGFQYTTVGTGLATGSAFFLGTTNGTSDTDFSIALGNGSQNGIGKHSHFHVYNSGAACEIWDTQGFSGTGLTAGFGLGISPGAGGSAYHAADTVGYSLPGGNCVGTVPVNTVNGSGAVTALGTFTMTTNSGCVLGATMSATGGTGTGLVLIITGVGTAATTCCTTVWLNGATTPVTSTTDVYGIHAGTMAVNGAWLVNSGWGSTPQSPCSVCGNVFWQATTSTLKQQTSNLLGGHPAIGVTHRGVTANPQYVTSLWSDPTCTPSSNCPTLFSPLPTNSLTHSRWPTPDFTDNGPIILSSVLNVPAKGQQPSNPPGWTSGFALSNFAVEQNGTTHWFIHSFENTNNTNVNEDFNAVYVITICSQDRKFCIAPMDCFSGFAGNVGCGNISGGSVPYPPEFAFMTN